MSEREIFVRKPLRAIQCDLCVLFVLCAVEEQGWETVSHHVCMYVWILLCCALYFVAFLLQLFSDLELVYFHLFFSSCSRFLYQSDQLLVRSPLSCGPIQHFSTLSSLSSIVFFLLTSELDPFYSAIRRMQLPFSIHFVMVGDETLLLLLLLHSHIHSYLMAISFRRRKKKFTHFVIKEFNFPTLFRASICFTLSLNLTAGNHCNCVFHEHNESMLFRHHWLATKFLQFLLHHSILYSILHVKNRFSRRCLFLISTPIGFIFFLYLFISRWQIVSCSRIFFLLFVCRWKR